MGWVANRAAEVAETSHLPPTLSLQYHFNPTGKFQPYLGAEVNFTKLFSDDTYGAPASTDLDLDDSWGLAGQIGADFMINQKWFLNVDVHFIDIDSDATLDGADLGTVEIDP